MKAESQFACLLIVEKAGPTGIDAPTFSARRWPEHKLHKQEGGNAQLCSGAAALLTGLAEEELLEKIGEGRDARYVLTWKGRDFLASFVSDRQTAAKPPAPAVDDEETADELEEARETIAEQEGAIGILTRECDRLRQRVAQLEKALAAAQGGALFEGMQALGWRRRAETAEAQLRERRLADEVRDAVRAMLPR